jgi:hypothetical protein
MMRLPRSFAYSTLDRRRLRVEAERVAEQNCRDQVRGALA